MITKGVARVLGPRVGRPLNSEKTQAWAIPPFEFRIAPGRMAIVGRSRLAFYRGNQHVFDLVPIH